MALELARQITQLLCRAISEIQKGLVTKGSLRHHLCGIAAGATYGLAPDTTLVKFGWRSDTFGVGPLWDPVRWHVIVAQHRQ